MPEAFIPNPSRCRPLLLALALLAATSALAASPVPPKKASEPSITLNYKDADIREVAATIGEITHKNFVIDPQVKGRVTVVSSRPIPPDAVYETFLSILQVHDYAAVPAGDVVKIIPAVNARQVPGDDMPSRITGPGDEIVTQVVPVQNVPAAQLVAVLRPLVPQYGHLAVFAPANMLIISDRAGNVERLMKIIRRIDQAGNQGVEVIPLENAAANDVVRVLNALNQASQQNNAGTPQPAVVADERTNSVLIGGDKTERLRLRALIAHLDTPLQQGGNTQVIYLHYADAQKLADVLKGYVPQSSGSGSAGAAGGAKAPPGSPASTDVTIVPDPETNSLVITASPKTMRQLRNVIDKLDIRRAQVLVEAIIVELTSDKSAELGITWATDAINGHGVAGLTNYSGTGAGIAQLAAAAQSDNPAAAAASLPDGLNLAFGRVNKGKFSFAGLLRALAGDANTNILSTPSIVTMDNEEAHIEVGQKVPFVTGQFTNTGAGSNNGSVNPFQTIQRESVGIKLDITPQINEGNSIKLKIQQEASSLSQSAAGAGNPITNERKIETTVMVDNGEIIVLGGLIDTNLSENEQRVPVLGSIPLLGNLFKYRKTTKTKRNLMVFLQPAIIRDRQDTRYYTDSKYNYIRQLEQGRRKEGVQLMPGEQRPVIPSADESRSRVRTPQSSSGNQDQPADGANQDTTKQSEQDTNGGSSR